MDGPGFLALALEKTQAYAYPLGPTTAARVLRGLAPSSLQMAWSAPSMEGSSILSALTPQIVKY